MEINEDPSEYRKTNKQLLEKIVGIKNTIKLYEHFISDNSILNASEQELIASGITARQAEILTAAKGLCKEDIITAIHSSRDSYNILKYISKYNVEHFVVIPLDRANKILCNPITISIGGTSGTVVDTKVLFKKILVHNRVCGIILAHNHPSNNWAPSDKDIELTKKVVSSALLLDIKVLDHLIICENGYYSFNDNDEL